MWVCEAQGRPAIRASIPKLGSSSKLSAPLLGHFYKKGGFMKNNKDKIKKSMDNLIARYSRGSASLKVPGNYITKEDKDKLKEKVLKHKFN